MNGMGLLDPRLSAYLQRAQMNQNPQMRPMMPPQMGGGMMPQMLPQGMMRPGMMRPNMPTNMGQYAPPMPRVNGVAANLPPPQNYFPAPIIRSDGLNYFPAPIIRSDVPMGTLRPGAPTRPQLPGDRTMYTVNRPFAVP